ncbi:RsmF rRNA methyltransferase first C-terminal domain-containing protein [Virgibacillus sp. 179-BFC.A HS]|uniref:RsmF rRNA methyltransferase first C-terminal domain-containing protein n=1 Tax=Tigheibacillus jepli TaxID=3035914 RepID=A0ABU5CDI8_9BACI|nr:RsmF rRNA methyltransferase first C-terminal domain-containing protein [Virgibacillus sp. 179-BFC.A HS]MDY0404403.1 RsmF rRNA methyltransferase first C-terminal domain-containing protein [Virgibacillus sp. 179-BFC.A HS]
MELPQAFRERMKKLLRQDYADFIQSYEQARYYGLRVNTLKISVDDFLQIAPFALTPVPWTETGFYYGEADRPGKHPYHEAGLYYIQEPSAMAAAVALDAQQGENVLDLAAAPGGKATHIAAMMKQDGLLIANEIHPQRAGILSQNIERMGIRNAVVTNEKPAKLAKRFPGFFDRILLDAPCSGEGMFRKNPEAIDEWSPENVAQCALRQSEILDFAAEMLRPGGRLVYSTCTFSTEENEGTISRFLREHSEFELREMNLHQAFDHGIPVPDAVESISKTTRIWPHHVKGEGHYIAVMQKTSGETKMPKLAVGVKNKKLLQDFDRFANDTLTFVPEGKFILFGDQLYLLPENMPDMDGLKVIRPGWHLGTMKKNRFEPSHALALSLHAFDVKFRKSFASDSDDIHSFLKGEVLQATGPKGWYLVEVDGYSLGWAKQSGTMLKNHFPKGLRWK